MADANWGPQDTSIPMKSLELPLFSRSMPAFYIDLLGPLHWLSKCQKVTAASLAGAEIYATDECVKFLLELVQMLDFLEVNIFMPQRISFITTIKLVFNGQKVLPQKDYVIF
jgi:hypothetical protein